MPPLFFYNLYGRITNESPDTFSYLPVSLCSIYSLSTWYVEDSKIDFKNENTAHGNRLLLFYKSKIIEIEKDECFSNNCKKYSHCSTNSKPNSAYCSSTNSHCVQSNLPLYTQRSRILTS